MLTEAPRSKPHNTSRNKLSFFPALSVNIYMNQIQSKRRNSAMRKRSLTRQVGVVLTERTYASLIKLTDEKEVPVSEFIRGILESVLQKTAEEGKEKGK